ncbi:hypothetical protein GCM10027168_71340 [Streptomyces capparidis]
MHSPANPALDRQELTGLVSRLSHLLDDLDTGGLAAIYTEDAVGHSPRGTLRGIEEFRALIDAADPEDGKTQHITTDVLVELGPDGPDEALVTANALTYFFHPGRPPHRTAGLRSRFTARRTDAGWRFTHHTNTLLWIRES